uniref:RNA helicase n=1 Tax=Globodera rostochiensis TaxID=31243 RepID=A0A914HFW4_GLORO
MSDLKICEMRELHNNCNGNVEDRRNGSLMSSSSRPGSSMSVASSAKQPFKRIPLQIDRYRKQLTAILHSLDKVAIFIGETACGKSTQIPQLCLRAPWASEGTIIVTQPRRVAAKMLGMRVAQELGSSVGDLVGYKFRFENETSERCRLVYMTEGILLRQMLHNCRLNSYSAIIVDEVHERSVNTDVLLYILRQAQRDRAARAEPPLRILLMSATLDARPLSEYFDGATVYYVKGRMHSVKIFNSPELKLNDNDYLFNAVSAVLELHDTEPIEHGFLVFLTGQEEIDTALNILRKLKQSKSDAAMEEIYAIPLYAAVPTAVTQRAFEPPPRGHRKVLFATNIAETSVTIPGIDVVIDSGKVKRRSFVACNRVDVLRVENISKAQAIQRAGRAGREGPGKCYRLYSLEDYNRLADEQEPELQRCRLTTVLLELVELGVEKVSSLVHLLSPPDINQLRAAVEELLALRAVTLSTTGHLKITEEGSQLLTFPVEPAHAKILLAASELGCLEEACTVVSFMSADPVFQFSGHDLFCLNEKQKFGQEDNTGLSGGLNMKFRTNEGDHARMVQIYRAFTSVKRIQEKMKEFCESNNLNQRRMEQVWSIRKQLHEECMKHKLHFSTSANNMELLRRAICRGLFLNLCRYDTSIQCYVLDRDRKVQVRIHPSSCLHNQRPAAFVFTELMHTNEVYARDISLVQTEWVHESGTDALRDDPKLLERVHCLQMVMPQPTRTPLPSTSAATATVASSLPSPTPTQMPPIKTKRKKRRKMLVTYSTSGSSSDDEKGEDNGRKNGRGGG